MASTRELQAAIMAHKRRMGFNTTDVHREVCLTTRELAELHEAIDKGRADEVGGELADVAIYVLSLLDFLAYGREQNHLAPTGIRLPDGSLLEGAELDEALRRHEQAVAEIQDDPRRDA
jgi:NTP pyrophosphatase (non-canonical NTP hydrolase)